MKNLKLGVIGAGRIGRVHVQNLLTRIGGVEITRISDCRIDQARSLAKDYHIKNVSEGYGEILNDPAIDAILICSSTDTHSQITIEAAQAGKHIFCEKPIDLSLEKIDSALKAVQKSQIKFQVGFNRRFDPNFKKIGESVRRELIGLPHLVRITSRDPSPPPAEYVKVSGGIFMDMTIHDFDMARYIINDEVTEVFAATGNLIDPKIKEAGDVDTAMVTLKYKSGALCCIDNSRKATYGYDQRLEVFGTKGCLVASNNTATNTELWSAESQSKDLPLHFFLERYTESFVAEMREFIECVQTNKTPSVSGHDGRQAAVLAMAAKKSALENRPVKLTEIL
ncbi:MAG: inositol 2-dehydrogenase [Oligoflexia bacterium]|nr:inositol 2-dehydrogenase [Oligoflexia bacterium]